MYLNSWGRVSCQRGRWSGLARRAVGWEGSLTSGWGRACGAGLTGRGLEASQVGSTECLWTREWDRQQCFANVTDGVCPRSRLYNWCSVPTIRPSPCPLRYKRSRCFMNVETGAEPRLLIEDMVEPARERLFLLSHDSFWNWFMG